MVFLQKLILVICCSLCTKCLITTEALLSSPPSRNGKCKLPAAPLSLLTGTGTPSQPPISDNDDNESTDPPSPPAIPATVQVAIAGGGLGGLAVCVALRARGIDAHIFESSPALEGRGSTGTGIMISKNGWQALGAIDGAAAVGDGKSDGSEVDGIGLVREMRSYGSRITRQTITKSDPSGSVASTFSFNATDQYNIGWTRAHEVLLAKVPPEVIHCNCHFHSYRPAQAAPDGRDEVDISFRDGRTVRTSLLIGADGAGSAVRRFMAQENQPDDPKAAESSYEMRYSGQLLWNAILPTSDILPLNEDDGPVHGPGEVEYTLCGTDGQVILAFDAGDNQTSWYLTLMERDVHAADAVSNPALAQIQNSLRSKTFGGFGRPGLRSQLLHAFAPWPSATRLLTATPEDQIFERRLADRPPLARWTDDTACRNRVVLMGDAAHPMVPSQGQGTMVTWEDAADLAAVVAPCLGVDGAGLEAAVERFVEGRAERCTRVQQFSAERYMGAELPKFPPRKMLKMLWMKRSFEHMIDGYTPMEGSIAPVKRRVTKRSRVLRIFGLGGK